MAFFKKKLDRVVNVEKSEEKFKKQMENMPLEKNDGLAMIIAAVITFIPALIIVGGFFLLVIYLFFLR